MTKDFIKAAKVLSRNCLDCMRGVTYRHWVGMIQVMFVICLLSIWPMICVASVHVDRQRKGQTADDERLPFAITANWQFAVIIENDGAFKYPDTDDDRHYTHGAMLVFGGVFDHTTEAAQALMPLPGLFERKLGPAEYTGGVLLGQRIHTPADIQTFLPIPGDVPYSGHLYFGGFFQRRSTSGCFMDHLQLEFGVTGPSSGGEFFQERWHELFGFQEVNGWDNQTLDEPTVQVYYRPHIAWDLVLPASWGIDMDVIGHAEVALGTVERHFGTGFMCRIGHGIPDDFGPLRMGQLNYFGDVHSKERFTTYLYGGLKGRVVDWNLYLEGNQFSSFPLGVDPRLMNGEIQAGLVFAWHFEHYSIESSYYYTWLSRTFESQQDTDSYAGFYLKFVYQN